MPSSPHSYDLARGTELMVPAGFGQAPCADGAVAGGWTWPKVPVVVVRHASCLKACLEQGSYTKRSRDRSFETVRRPSGPDTARSVP